MKPSEILSMVFDLLQGSELGADVYERFSDRYSGKPIDNPIVLLDIESGEEDKTIVSIDAFMPATYGASACRTLIDNIRSVLAQEQLDGYRLLAEKAMEYDSSLKAYKKQATALFEADLIQIPIMFGEETIVANSGTMLISKRRVVDYFSPVVGDRVQNLNQYAKQIVGTAYMDSEQFLRLYELLESGLQSQVTVVGVTFDGILSELSGNGNVCDPVSFVIQEVPE